MRDEKQEELLYPKVRGLSVLEKTTKFNNLLHYAGPEVSTEAQKIRHFHKWMSPALKPWMEQREFQTLEQYVDAAYKMENTLVESDRKTHGRGRSHHGSQVGFKRPGSPQVADGSKKNKTGPAQSNSSQVSGQCRNVVTCYNCGKEGHINKI